MSQQDDTTRGTEGRQEYAQTDDSGTTTGDEGMGSMGRSGDASTGDAGTGAGGSGQGVGDLSSSAADNSASGTGAPGTGDPTGGQGSVTGAPNTGTSTAPRTDPSMQSGGTYAGPGDVGPTEDAGEPAAAEYGGGQEDPQDRQPRGFGSQSGHGTDTQAGAATPSDQG